MEKKQKNYKEDVPFVITKTTKKENNLTLIENQETLKNKASF